MNLKETLELVDRRVETARNEFSISGNYHGARTEFQRLCDAVQALRKVLEQVIDKGSTLALTDERTVP